MDVDKISALPDDRLRLLRDRAKSRPNDPTAQSLLSLIDAEQEKRRKARKKPLLSPLRWTEQDRLYEAFLDNRLVATIKKVDNHSMIRRDVYHAMIGERFFGKFEKIREAKEAVSREVLLMGDVARATSSHFERP